MKDRRWLRAASLLALVALIAAAFAAVSSERPGEALGPVIAVTPDELGDPSCCMMNPAVSGRGEVVAAYEGEVTDNGLALLTNNVREGFLPEGDFEQHEGITVSGDGCTALEARRISPSTATSPPPSGP